METNNLEEITIYYVSGAVSIIYADRSTAYNLMNYGISTELDMAVKPKYKDTPNGPLRSMWLNLNNVERIVQK